VTFHVAVALDPGSYGTRQEQIPGQPPLTVPSWLNTVLGVLVLALRLSAIPIATR